MLYSYPVNETFAYAHNGVCFRDGNAGVFRATSGCKHTSTYMVIQKEVKN